MPRLDKIISNFKEGQMEEFYTSVYPSLITYASRILGNDYSFLAEDCVQDSIYKNYEQRDTFKTDSHFMAYLYTSIHNKAVSYLRKRDSMQNYLSNPQDNFDDLQASIIEQETLNILYSAIDSLPENLHSIFELSFEKGLRNEDVAQQLKISVSTVKKRKAKLISTLKDKMVSEHIPANMTDAMITFVLLRMASVTTQV